MKWNVEGLSLGLVGSQAYGQTDFQSTIPVELRTIGMSDSLPDDAVLYTHTEQQKVLCANCWVSETVEHADCAEVHHRVVTGNLCVPGTMSAEATRGRLDALLAGQDTARLFIPDLSLVLSDTVRAAVESRRLGMILDSKWLTRVEEQEARSTILGYNRKLVLLDVFVRA